MNIQGLMGNNRGYGLQGQQTAEDKKAQMEEIISHYDPENFTNEDMTSLRQELGEAGIPRSRMVTDALNASGLELEKDENGQNAAALDREEGRSIRDLLRQFKDGDITKDELAVQIDTLKNSLENQSGLVVDTST